MTTYALQRLIGAAALLALAGPALAQSITVKDASGTTQTIRVPNSNGRAAAASSAPVVLSNEDKARLDAVSTAAKQPALGTAGTAATDVITVQGIAGAVPQSVSGSAGVALQQAGTSNALVVGGSAADGSAPVNNSVHISGLDGGGLKRSLLTDSAGRLQIGVATAATPYHYTSAASTNSTLVATGARTLYSLTITGLNTTAAYVRIYDSAAAPACSSATGAVHTYLVIGSATQQGGLIVPLSTVGEAYVNGLAFCITGGASDTDNTAAVAGVLVNASYK